MFVETQDTRYFNRMASSIGDKKNILPHLKSGRVLDVGAGGGELSEAIRLEGNNAVAIDGSIVAVERIKENYPKVNAVYGMAHDAIGIFGEESFDSIVCSAILHEVYSYRKKYYTVEYILRDFRDLLKTGGRLVIRDGIMPSFWSIPMHLTLNDDGVKFLEYYRENSKHYSDTEGFRKVSFAKVSENAENETVTFRGTLASAMEFMYTYTWGWGSAEREVQELYGIFTMAQYRDVLEEYGFLVVHREEYVQQGYVDALSDKLSLTTVNGVDIGFPSTNALIVAEKV